MTAIRLGHEPIEKIVVFVDKQSGGEPGTGWARTRDR
jgi:hypothetical protein